MAVEQRSEHEAKYQGAGEATVQLTRSAQAEHADRHAGGDGNDGKLWYEICDGIEASAENDRPIATDWSKIGKVNSDGNRDLFSVARRQLQVE